MNTDDMFDHILFFSLSLWEMHRAERSLSAALITHLLTSWTSLAARKGRLFPIFLPAFSLKHCKSTRSGCAAQLSIPFHHENQSQLLQALLQMAPDSPGHVFFFWVVGKTAQPVSSEQLEKGKQRTGKQHLLLQPCLILCSRTKPLDTPIWPAQCAARTLKAFMSQSWNQKLQCVLIQLLTSVSLKAVTGHVFILSELYISAPITSNLSWGSPDK